jgi:hypothetical protein
MAAPGEKPLEGWKEIAGYLGRSVRTVQRWEIEKGLPVQRHEALGVIAYPSDLDAWSKRVKQAELAPPAAPAPESADQPALSALAHGLVSPGLWLKRRLPSGAWAALAAAVAVPVLADSYGLAILALWVGAICVVVRLGSTAFQRALAALYLVAAMAYTCSASTMPEFHALVINATALAPSPAFLLVLGLKFIPLFVLVLGYAVALTCGGHKPKSKTAYTVLGVIFLGVEFIFLGLTSGDERVWEAGFPGRWVLLISSFVILALNLVVWLAARRWLFEPSPSSHRSLFLTSATAYLVVAVAAFFVDHQHNLINRYYLDVRWPQAYAAANPDAIDDFRNASSKDLRSKIGPELAALLNDPDFIAAVHHGRFYKQHSDEPFQLFNRAVIYAYRTKPASSRGLSPFVAIRFPQELADVLRFQPIEEK